MQSMMPPRVLRAEASRATNGKPRRRACESPHVRTRATSQSPTTPLAGAPLPRTMVYLSLKGLGAPTQFSNELLYFAFQRHPRAFNVTTVMPTAIISDPSTCHPQQISVRRRLEAFDPKKLHWSVAVPSAFSKRSSIRDHARRRCREAFRTELRLAGWDSDGRRIPGGGSSGREQKFDLEGALKLTVKHPAGLTMTGEQLRENAGWMVKKLVYMQREQSDRQPKAKHARNQRPHGQIASNDAGEARSSDPIFRKVALKG